MTLAGYAIVAAMAAGALYAAHRIYGTAVAAPLIRARAKGLRLSVWLVAFAALILLAAAAPLLPEGAHALALWLLIGAAALGVVWTLRYLPAEQAELGERLEHAPHARAHPPRRVLRPIVIWLVAAAALIGTCAVVYQSGTHHLAVRAAQAASELEAKAAIGAAYGLVGLVTLLGIVAGMCLLGAGIHGTARYRARERWIDEVYAEASRRPLSTSSML